jgi:hypothetical protein
MNISVKQLLVVLALLFTVAHIAGWPLAGAPTLAIAVLLLCIALLV